MASAANIREIQKLLQRTESLIAEIRSIFPIQDPKWRTHDFRNECDEIRQHCQRISILLQPSPPPGNYESTPPG